MKLLNALEINKETHSLCEISTVKVRNNIKDLDCIKVRNMEENLLHAIWKLSGPSNIHAAFFIKAF